MFRKIIIKFFKLKITQNLHSNKSGFVRPGHNYIIYVFNGFFSFTDNGHKTCAFVYIKHNGDSFALCLCIISDSTI